jgi:hypothetical protein
MRQRKKRRTKKRKKKKTMEIAMYQVGIQAISLRLMRIVISNL